MKLQYSHARLYFIQSFLLNHNILRKNFQKSKICPDDKNLKKQLKMVLKYVHSNILVALYGIFQYSQSPPFPLYHLVALSQAPPQVSRIIWMARNCGGCHTNSNPNILSLSWLILSLLRFYFTIHGMLFSINRQDLICTPALAFIFQLNKLGLF